MKQATIKDVHGQPHEVGYDPSTQRWELDGQPATDESEGFLTRRQMRRDGLRVLAVQTGGIMGGVTYQLHKFRALDLQRLVRDAGQS